MDCSETDKAHGPKMHGAGRFAVAAAEAPVKAVACVGLAVLDFIFGIDVRPDRGRKAFADSMTVIGGGPAATAAAAVARLDGNASFIGQLGNDAVGDLIIGDFARWGVDTSRVRRHPSASSPVSTITVEADGERTIINHTDPRLLESANQVTKDDLSGSDAVLGDLLGRLEHCRRWRRHASSVFRQSSTSITSARVRSMPRSRLRRTSCFRHRLSRR